MASAAKAYPTHSNDHRRRKGQANGFLRFAVVAAAGGLIALFFVTVPWRDLGRAQPAPGTTTSATATEATTGSQAQPQPPVDLASRASEVLNLYVGPSEDHAILGVVPKGGRLDVVGRDESGAWLAVLIAPASKMYAWAPAAQVSNPPSLATLPVKPFVPIPSR